MPLSPAICRRLAMANPEIRAHEWRVGDWYYSREHRTERPGVLVSVTSSEEGGYEVQDQVGDKPAPFELGEEWDWVWCPRLDQLLKLADDKSSHAGVLVCLGDEFLFDTVPYDYNSIIESGQKGKGAAPEEAVANWLLQQRWG